MHPCWRSARFPWIISRPCGNHSRRYVSTKTPRSSPWSDGSTTYTPVMVSDSVTSGMGNLSTPTGVARADPKAGSQKAYAMIAPWSSAGPLAWPTSGVPCVGARMTSSCLATTDVPWRDEPAEIVRCGDCGSVVISTVQPPSMYSEADWDWYVEQIAGIEAIAGMLVKVGAPSGSRMLDVGCGYGFGLDTAQVLFGWEGIGLDPSLAAERGRADLGLDIRPGTLDDAFEPEERFDVIFASEVLEHVPDPRAFLTSVHRRLSERGVFLMTTPDADAVTPETPMTVLYPALSVGAHEFLLTRAGLERMLARRRVRGRGLGRGRDAGCARGAVRRAPAVDPSGRDRVDP